ncbi:hypothetical protein BAUCODRAFT_571387 [Baudoinia panamericana UAMH 10762]|uniref:Uncharacterized protein n=1 Tax=Baudoinia panamericana (strain UAMH 10762) TaxID=717646 RepID=M2M3C3_BAUPA|nr:uncharacterized protein BAUCODRAFT_571387 [Baudoinia panamericana UAMH 10762]EMC91016.1 hypothetical protein BAUCODRAFT_571387 [Baudoinia panamericana UAMH 10762]
MHASGTWTLHRSNRVGDNEEARRHLGNDRVIARMLRAQRVYRWFPEMSESPPHITHILPSVCPSRTLAPGIVAAVNINSHPSTFTGNPNPSKHNSNARISSTRTVTSRSAFKASMAARSE